MRLASSDGAHHESTINAGRGHAGDCRGLCWGRLFDWFE